MTDDREIAVGARENGWEVVEVVELPAPPDPEAAREGWGTVKCPRGHNVLFDRFTTHLRCPECGAPMPVPCRSGGGEDARDVNGDPVVDDTCGARDPSRTGIYCARRKGHDGDHHGEDGEYQSWRAGGVGAPATDHDGHVPDQSGACTLCGAEDTRPGADCPSKKAPATEPGEGAADEKIVRAVAHDLLATKRGVAVGLQNGDEMSAGLIAHDAVRIVLAAVRPVSRDRAEWAALLLVEQAAREVRALFGGDPDAWKLDGRKVTDDASIPLLSLTDWLNTVEAVRHGVEGAAEHTVEAARKLLPASAPSRFDPPVPDREAVEQAKVAEIVDWLMRPDEALILAYVQSAFDPHITGPAPLQTKQALRDLAAIARHLAERFGPSSTEPTEEPCAFGPEGEHHDGELVCCDICRRPTCDYCGKREEGGDEGWLCPDCRASTEPTQEERPEYVDDERLSGRPTQEER